MRFMRIYNIYLIMPKLINCLIGFLSVFISLSFANKYGKKERMNETNIVFCEENRIVSWDCTKMQAGRSSELLF